MVGTIIDIAIVAIVVIFGLVGLFKGFMNSLLKLISSIGALAVAVFGARPVVGFVDGLFGFSKFLGNTCVNAICCGIDENLLNQTLTETSKQDFLNAINQDGLSIPERFIQSVLNNADMSSTMSIRDVLASSTGTIFACIIAGIVLFILVKLIVFIVGKIFDTGQGNNAISGVDKVLGFVFGVAKGAVSVVVIYTVLSVVCLISPLSNQVTEVENNTTIFKATYEPYSEIVQNFVQDKMATFVEDLTNKFLSTENSSTSVITFDYNTYSVPYDFYGCKLTN